MKGWENLGTTEDENEMATMFGEHIEEALNEVAPWKTIKVRTNHVFGLSDVTKETMKKRDILRKECQTADPPQKRAAHIKLNKLEIKLQLYKEKIILTKV